MLAVIVISERQHEVQTQAYPHLRFSLLEKEMNQSLYVVMAARAEADWGAQKGVINAVTTTLKCGSSFGVGQWEADSFQKPARNRDIKGKCGEVLEEEHILGNWSWGKCS